MPTSFLVEFLSKIPYETINAAPYCVWSYRISWKGQAPEVHPDLGVVLSSGIDIKDPAHYKDLAVIQDVTVRPIPAAGQQFVFRTIDLAGDPSPVEVSFLAPCAEDPFSPMALATAIPEAGSLVFLDFATDAESQSAREHVGRAPAAVVPNVVSALENSIRTIEKGTHVALTEQSTSDAPSELGNALMKYGFVRQLQLQSGEVDQVRKRLSASTQAPPPTSSMREDIVNWVESFLGGRHATAADLPASGEVWDILHSFEGSPLPALLPASSVFATIPMSAIRSFGQALQSVRAEAVTAAREPGQAAESFLLQAAAMANTGFSFNSGQAPVGMLNLERIEMAPAGIERGGLLATIPLAPREETAVIQKEWSVTTSEFTSIVTDSLESVSETGVTDNTELAQSTTSQSQHANQFNITGTVTGGIPVIHGSVSSSFGAQDSTSQSATDSRKHAVALTQKASSRVKKEHKVTISTTTVTGTQETTTRTLINPSETDPMRIDYFSLMRKWQVRLYRYGLRLTYDIVIPEPAGALRKAYEELDRLQNEIGPFTFKIPHSEVTDATLPGETEPHYLVLAERYGAVVPDPPAPRSPVIVTVTAPNTDGAQIFNLPEIDAPDGYWITNLWLRFHSESKSGVNYKFKVLGSNLPEVNESQGDHGPDDLASVANGSLLFHATGKGIVSVRLEDNRQTWISLTALIEPTDQARDQWTSDVWNGLYSAAQTQYFAQQQDIAAQITALENQLANVDTLTLRREESEEIMKGALRFLLGYGFDFMPQEVIDAIKSSGADVQHGVGFTGNDIGLDPAAVSVVRQDEDRVRFINEAIEWENVVSFLYSYFWDVPDSWDFIRQIQHPDALRQAFLRAGSARVVLTIRRGWEDAWVRFVDTGDPSGVTNSPYLTIAQEIAAYDDRNYPGIPPANPGEAATHLEDAIYTTSETIIDGPKTNVEIEVGSTSGFIVGRSVVVDTTVSSDPQQRIGRQEATTVTEIRDATHMTLASIQYQHGLDASHQPQGYAVLLPGEKGVLIAEWSEYTPTSGTDIAVTSNLATIA